MLNIVNKIQQRLEYVGKLIDICNGAYISAKKIQEVRICWKLGDYLQHSLLNS